MWKITHEIWESLIGDKKQRRGLDGGRQLGRRLSFLDTEDTKGDEETEKENEKFILRDSQ